MRLHVDVHLCGFISPRKWLHLYNNLFTLVLSYTKRNPVEIFFNGFDRMKKRIKKNVR